MCCYHCVVIVNQVCATIVMLPLCCHYVIIVNQICVVVVLLCYWLNMCYCCAIGQVCYVITIVEKKHFENLLLFSYSSYHLHTFEMAKGSKTMEKGTPKTTNRLHTKEDKGEQDCSRRRKQ